uniref:ATP synthase F0 subunit 8 n=1 Tax=Rhodogorgon sp. TaxID=2485824 RepID=A0A3G3MIR4_9FLOR|nr:ATP synthase F0 subunit 8 [Rhodogorgon sp.]
MPQLDYIIIFPQIFWLMLIFTIMYSGLLHFFLPVFVKLIRSRKLIISSNVNKTIGIEKKLLEKQIFLNKVLNKNLFFIKTKFMKNIMTSLSIKREINMQSIDVKIIKALYNNVLYCNNQVLNCIILEPRLLNLKFKK